MNIIEAVKAAFKGKKIRRKSWFYIDNDRCNYVARSEERRVGKECGSGWSP